MVVFSSFSQRDKLGLNRVGCGRVKEILRTGKAAEGFASPVFVCSFALKALMKKATRGETTGLASGKAA